MTADFNASVAPRAADAFPIHSRKGFPIPPFFLLFLGDGFLIPLVSSRLGFQKSCGSTRGAGPGCTGNGAVIAAEIFGSCFQGFLNTYTADFLCVT